MSLLLFGYLIKDRGNCFTLILSPESHSNITPSAWRLHMLMASGIGLFIDIWRGPLWKLIIIIPRDNSSLKSFRLVGHPLGTEKMQRLFTYSSNRKQNCQSTISGMSFSPWPCDSSSSEPDSARRKVNKSRIDNIWGTMILKKTIADLT